MTAFRASKWPIPRARWRARACVSVFRMPRNFAEQAAHLGKENTGPGGSRNRERGEPSEGAREGALPDHGERGTSAWATRAEEARAAAEHRSERKPSINRCQHPSCSPRAIDQLAAQKHRRGTIRYAAPYFPGVPASPM